MLQAPGLGCIFPWFLGHFFRHRPLLPVLWIRIRIRSDPNFLAGSGYGSGKYHSGSRQLRIRNEFELKLLWKTDKIWQYFNKNAQFENVNSFLSKQNYLKSIYLVIIYNLTHLQDGNTKVKFMIRLLENSCRIRNRNRIRNQMKSKIRIRIWKKLFRIHNTASFLLAGFCR